MPNNPSDSPAKTSGLGRHWWIFLPGGLIFLVLLYLVPHALTAELQTSPLARLTLETQIRDSWAKLLWAGVTLLGASFIWRYLQSLGQVVENSSQTLAAAERTAFFSAQAAETERYARAMALLGDDKIEVKLGGIYALERLARESERDHGPIMEVLAAFVRENARWNESGAAPARTEADVQAILTVIGRRHAPFDRAETHLDLHGTALSRAYLPYAHLAGAQLYESNLDGALLQGANLRGAWCWKSSWAGAVLDGAHLEGADLTGASGLTLEQIQSAYRDSATKLPDHLRGGLESAAPKTALAAPVVTPVAPVVSAPPLNTDSERGESAHNQKLPTRRAPL